MSAVQSQIRALLSKTAANLRMLPPALLTHGSLLSGLALEVEASLRHADAPVDRLLVTLDRALTALFLTVERHAVEAAREKNSRGCPL
jgi:hypothetical protein